MIQANQYFIRRSDLKVKNKKMQVEEEEEEQEEEEGWEGRGREGPERVRERLREPREASSPLHSGPGLPVGRSLPGCCQVTVGWSLHKILNSELTKWLAREPQALAFCDTSVKNCRYTLVCHYTAFCLFD